MSDKFYKALESSASAYDVMDQFGVFRYTEMCLRHEINTAVNAALLTMVQHTYPDAIGNVFIDARVRTDHVCDCTVDTRCMPTWAMYPGDVQKTPMNNPEQFQLMGLTGFSFDTGLKRIGPSNLIHCGKPVELELEEPARILLAHLTHYKPTNKKHQMSMLGVGALNHLTDLGYQLMQARVYRDPNTHDTRYVEYGDSGRGDESGRLHFTFHNPSAHYKLIYFWWDQAAQSRAEALFNTLDLKLP